MSTNNLEIKDVFEKERFPKCNWQFISLLLYLPVGLVLATVRFFIGCQLCLAGLLLSHTPYIRSIVLRVLCFVLGLSVEEDNKCSRKCKLMVGNCVSKIDYIPMHLVTGCVSPSDKQSMLSGLVPGLKDFSNTARSLASIKSFLEKACQPVFLQPEETTSGKKILLKFTGLPAELSSEVQPVSIVVERPAWANPSVTVLGASFAADMFWFLFTPTTLFKIKYLNVVEREEEESHEQFVSRLERTIADSLNYKTCSYTNTDKAEYEKRYLEEYNRQHSHPVLNQGTLNAHSNQLHTMVHQVHQVLPHVPREVILQDIRRTRSVDLTISNILEGLIPFVPVPVEPSPPPSEVSGEPLFSKLSEDRMMSFAERKAKMIEEARQRYIAKHGLHI